ncbi:hypothetical protein NDU88_005053 [Pleurodeles waltl]|uniref:Uncharacterized protein n=1 Tax=Pleurodeles waltl TaxID=8319 RepID=A0AAV7TBE2_PLEWA|nr:hypothetical protein NDU88_005053 [Pleurodeles waltl]
MGTLITQAKRRMDEQIKTIEDLMKELEKVSNKEEVKQLLDVDWVYAKTQTEMYTFVRKLRLIKYYAVKTPPSKPVKELHNAIYSGFKISNTSDLAAINDLVDENLVDNQDIHTSECTDITKMGMISFNTDLSTASFLKLPSYVELIGADN